jgi:Raf kinase inhibitor-like YbhB/YbcL family protein
MLKLTSPDFQHDGPIPARFTCEGDDATPRLEWSGVPAGTRSLALIVDDPDAPDPAAPKMTWVHWVVFDIPPTATQVDGARQGKNDWKRIGWGGPCPPIGRHHYHFKLYALDAELKLDAPTKAELERAMIGHVIEKAELVGTYQKGQRP